MDQFAMGNENTTYVLIEVVGNVIQQNLSVFVSELEVALWILSEAHILLRNFGPNLSMMVLVAEKRVT